MGNSTEDLLDNDNLERYIKGFFPEYSVKRLQRERDLVQVIPDNEANVESIINKAKETMPPVVEMSRFEGSVIFWSEED